MTLKTLAAAACISLGAASTAAAATYDFSFDASTATSGDKTLKASGTLDINVSAGETFTSSDVSNLSIEVSSDLFSTFNLNTFVSVAGSVATTGLSATFTDLFLARSSSIFGCDSFNCNAAYITATDGTFGTFSNANYTTAADTLSQFVATAQVSAVPLPAGGLLLLSGLGGVAALKRRKKRTA